MLSHLTFYSCDKISEEVHGRREDLFWLIASGHGHSVPLLLGLREGKSHVTWHAVEQRYSPHECREGERSRRAWEQTSPRAFPSNLPPTSFNWKVSTGSQECHRIMNFIIISLSMSLNPHEPITFPKFHLSTNTLRIKPSTCEFWWRVQIRIITLGKKTKALLVP